MSDELKNEKPDLTDGVELNDEALDSVAGGFIYHDAGDAAAHRKEAFYVIDDAGNIVMRLDNAASAKHWANNLRTSQKLISAAEFEALRNK